MIKLISELVAGVARSISFAPAICVYSPTPNIDQCYMEWRVSRNDCGIVFSIPTHWYLAHVRGQVGNQVLFRPVIVPRCRYNSPRRIAEGDLADWVDGKIIYSSECLTSGVELFDRFVGDPEMLWIEMERLLGWLEGKQNENI